MLAKVGGKPKAEIPMYGGSLNIGELMDWIRSLDQYFDYEEVDERKKVKFAVTRLRGHAAIWWDELQTSRTKKGKSKIKLWDKMSQRNRGKSLARGKGTTRPRGQQHQHEAGSSSSRPPQRGKSNRGRFVPRGRGRGRDVRCYTCGEWGHMSWDCPHNKPASQRNANVAEAKPEPPRLMEKEERLEEGESLLLSRTLLRAEPEIGEPTERKNLFRTTCKSKGKCCKVIIDTGSTNNLVFIEMVDKLGLAKTMQPTPYKVSWL
eukprot:PITA_24789